MNPIFFNQEQKSGFFFLFLYWLWGIQHVFSKRRREIPSSYGAHFHITQPHAWALFFQHYLSLIPLVQLCQIKLCRISLSTFYCPNQKSFSSSGYSTFGHQGLPQSGLYLPSYINIPRKTLLFHFIFFHLAFPTLPSSKATGKEIQELVLRKVSPQTVEPQLAHETKSRIERRTKC